MSRHTLNPKPMLILRSPVLNIKAPELKDLGYFMEPFKGAYSSYKSPKARGLRKSERANSSHGFFRTAAEGPTGGPQGLQGALAWGTYI